MLTERSLAQCLRCPPAVAAEWFGPLSREMARHRINAPRRIAHFIAQIGHESQSLTRGEENLRYSAKRLQEMAIANGPRSVWAKAAAQAARLANNPQALGNFVYALRNGNGNEASGDGWRFRGRGPIGLTGRANYAQMATATGLPLVEDPDRVSTVDGGAASACAWWAARGLNAYADRNEGLAIGRVINLGNANARRLPLGHEDRIERTRRAFDVLGVT